MEKKTMDEYAYIDRCEVFDGKCRLVVFGAKISKISQS